jgi:hypothetical protein
MPPIEAFGPAIAIGLILLVMLWFALGTQQNIRKGNDLLRWLQGGLPLLGKRTTLRWLGSSAVELGIVEPASPFREATVVIVLEPRDVSFLWAFARSRGRRDFVIVRTNLVRAPRFSLDVRDPSGWTGKPDRGDGDWGPVGWAAGGVAQVGPGADEQDVGATWNKVRQATGGVWRLTIQPVIPHLEIHFRPPPSDIGAEHALAPLRDLAARLARP